MSQPKAPARRRRKSADKEQLSRDDWLDAAAAAIAAGGFDNVRILTLAERLGVTRGSFYWHFQDHADLVVSFLERWRDRRLRELNYLRVNGPDYEGDLRRILHLLLSEVARNLRRMRIELAVRDYARRDEFAAKIVAEVDQVRINQNIALIEKITGDSEKARDLALLLYVSTIGSQLVLAGPTGDPDTISRMENLIAEIVLERDRAKQP